MPLKKVQTQANGYYNHGRDWAKKGADFLAQGLHEKRIGDFAAARGSLHAAIKNYDKAIDRYEKALGLLPSLRLQQKIEKKLYGLEACDLAFARKALHAVMPKTEPPMDDIRKRLGARKGDWIFPFPGGDLI